MKNKQVTILPPTDALVPDLPGDDIGAAVEQGTHCGLHGHLLVLHSFGMLWIIKCQAVCLHSTEIRQTLPIPAFPFLQTVSYLLAMSIHWWTQMTQY